MLISRENLEDELVQRVMVSNNSSMLPAARVTQLIQDAYQWAGTLHFWPPLYRARTFSTTPNTQSLTYDYYDYPSDFLTGSVSRLYIDNKKYDKKAYQDLIDYADNVVENSVPPDPTKRYFAEYGRQFFVYPASTVAGSSNGIIWGNIQPLQISTAASTTIFSLWNDSGNEAIVKKALSVALERFDPNFATTQKKEAFDLLELIWKKIMDENQKSQRLNHPFYQVPDFFGYGSGVSTIGNFNAMSVIF
jgi:hypothetical protein